MSADVEFGDATPEEGVTTGQRIAGAVLLLNGALVLYERTALAGALSFESALDSPMSSIFDVLIGIALLAGQHSVLGLAKFRAFAGALLFGGMYVVQGDPFMAGLQVLFSATLLALLLGEAGRARVAFASVLAVGFLGLELVGIQMLSTGRSPLSGLLAAQYDLEEIQPGAFQSELVPYRFEQPGAGWARRSDVSAKADNPLVDVWLVRPEYDAHIMVVAESGPEGSEIDLEAMVEAVESNARAGAQVFQIQSRGHVAAIHTLGTRMDAFSVVDGLQMRFRYGVFAQGRHGVQVVCFALEAGFDAIAPDCDAAIESFQFVDEPQMAHN